MHYHDYFVIKLTKQKLCVTCKMLFEYSDNVFVRSITVLSKRKVGGRLDFVSDCTNSWSLLIHTYMHNFMTICT